VVIKHRDTFTITKGQLTLTLTQNKDETKHWDWIRPVKFNVKKVKYYMGVHYMWKKETSLLSYWNFSCLIKDKNLHFYVLLTYHHIMGILHTVFQCCKNVKNMMLL